MSTIGSRPGLLGRHHECEKLSSLVAAAKAGHSGVLVLRGEAGIGKTALLEFLLERAVGCRVARAAGVESEMEIPFASLHQLCGPYLDRLTKLPVPQQEALGTVFGLRPGSAPDRFLVALAVLSLLTDVAEDRPLICVVDDAQWLDQASSETLEFVARRLTAEHMAMVFAARGSHDVPRFAGLPDLVLHGLGARDAARLLQSVVTGVLDPRVLDRILAECHGNPLALLELPRGLSVAELAFGGDSSAAAATSLAHRLEQGFLRQVQPLPRRTRQLLLTAAAEPVGDVPLLWRAAERLDIGAAGAAAAEATGLIEFRDRVQFRHPLVRSALYRSASSEERRAVHGALADVTDPDLDPDRRAWHRARAAVGTDEEVACDLERSADRALSHGGLAAAAAFLELAATLTPDPARRAQRALVAAQGKVNAGAFDDASALLSMAEVGPVGEAERARMELLQAQMAFAANRGNEALPLLLAAARRFEPLDPQVARDTYLDALSAALFAGRLAAGPGAREVAEAVRESPPPEAPRKDALLLEGLAVMFTDGYTPAAPVLDGAVHAFITEELSMDEALRSAWLAAATAASLWDDASWDALTRRHLDLVREAGALSALPLALNTRVVVLLFTGDLSAGTSLVEEAGAAVEATKSSLVPYGEVGLLALRGDAGRAEPLLQSCLEDVVARGEGVGVNMIQWARAVLCNGLGRYDDALSAAREATADPLELGPPKWALVELIEAGARSGNPQLATAALDELSTMAAATGTEWALGVYAGGRAQLQTGRAAEDDYREAIDRLAGTTVKVQLARTRLLYGEWLRRQGRHADARAHLRTAHETLSAMGVDAFAERARRELLDAGETVRKRTVKTTGDLTAEETHIARLAAQGFTNAEISAQLYVSPRTVEWHLGKVFTKVGVRSRRELRRAVLDSAPTTADA
ncbi:helix-turn-helix transcriptional regulator [Modestobacter excelsi]|uniref:helix-turn-helix transcriptional regulator n=1 Tax=Modestobacter excelsi TaxID=2213161 RepID=UPI00110CA0BB|nr:LuxR family transcriptional regulator [Modestobacter excelsi]